MTQITKDMNIIAGLGDSPVPSGDLTTAQFKAKFDEAGLAIKNYINNTLLSELAGANNGVRAASADTLTTARTFQIQDNSGTYSGTAVSFDGSGNIIIKLPATIVATIIGNVTGNVTGNADTATKLAATFNLSVSDGTHAGTVQTVDGSAAVTLPLPTTLDADLLPGTIVLDSDSYGTSFPSSPETGRLFFKKV